MSKMNNSSQEEASTVNELSESEKGLYFLIAKFLSIGPCQKAGEIIIKELQEQEIIPKRFDWKGNTHTQTYEEFNQKNPLPNNFLHKLVARVEPLLQQLIPQVPKRQHSLLSKSLLRNKKDATQQPSTLHEVVFRDSINKIQMGPLANSALEIAGKEISCNLRQRNFLTNKLYSRLQLFARNAGHLWAVYCLLYDRHGRYIITGADDMLVKIWSVVDGRLMATLRGASAEITDLAIDCDNTMIAAGSCDKIIRVWNLQTCAPIAVLSSHGGMIISLMFSPSPGNEGTLVSTGGDGCVAFWPYVKKDSKTTFDSKPLKFNERIRPGHAQLNCSSFSSGGNFLVIGGVDHFVRVYQLKEEVDKILEMEVHQDRVDSIQWCHSGIGFLSGSKDGTALIWRYKCQQWKTIKLNMTEVLPGECLPQLDVKKLSVTVVGWDLTDTLVITASSDKVVRVWESNSGRLNHCLKGHEDNVYVIEAHPFNPRIILTAGHDAQLHIWDIITGCSVKSFKNTIAGQGYGSLFDAKWAPDGLGIAATDSHGHILLFGIGQNDLFKKVPQELFFHTDYRPLMRDFNNHVLDEQTQLAPHLMPPPFLVNVDGNPYPPSMQRLVPGRQMCRDDQLVPNVILNDNGEREVVDPDEMGIHTVEVDEAVPQREEEEESNENIERPNIDQMIRRLAHEQDQRLGAGVRPHNVEHSYAAETNHGSISPRAGRVGARRDGDVEGVRQSTGNWQRGANIKFKTNYFVTPLTECELKQSECCRLAQSELELSEYETEMKKPAEVSMHFRSPSRLQPETAKVKKKPKNQTHSYSTRSMLEEDTVYFEEQLLQSSDHNSEGSGDVEIRNDLDSSESDGGSSTEYSDWTADAGVDLQPPKRTAHKQKRRLVKARYSRRRRADESPLSESDARINSESQEQTTTTTRRRRRAVKTCMDEESLDDIPDEYKPPEWLCETVPKKAPYFPQMGDELIYFQQGHQLYVEAVLGRKLYAIDSQTLPWLRKKNLREQEYVKIIGMKFEIKPPRLCCLKLGILDGEGTLTGDSFTIKYHDMADVLDFLVLKPAYDIAVGREWSQGDQFRCIIDDAWWFGQVESHEPHIIHFPDSMFLCYKVIWDNGEKERLSPWDMESIDEQTGIPEKGGSVRVRPKEYKSLLYTNWSENWNGRPFKSECKRIAEILSKVMELSAAEPFLAPVDLSAYPNYALLIEYPMDLSTIKSRLENFFYRSPNSVQFDVRYIATNAEKFNKKGSTIVKNARIITDLCLTIIQDPSYSDPTAFYHEAIANYHSPNHSDNEAVSGGPSHNTRRGRTRSSESSDDDLLGLNTPTVTKRDTRPWKQQCSDLIGTIFEREDSIPFRHPVNLNQYSDYNQVIDDPMDLMTMREELENGGYPSPVEFCKDMRLMLYNSKNYNTNKRSRIYSMTLRLEAFFEEQIKEILRNYTTAKGKVAGSIRQRRRQSLLDKGPRQHALKQNISIKISRIFQRHNDTLQPVWVSKKSMRSVPSTSNGYSRLSRRYVDTSDEEDDNSGQSGCELAGAKRRSRRVANLRRLRGDSDRDSDHSSARLRNANELSKGGSGKRSKKYEHDSDFEGPPTARPVRRLSTSSSGRSKKSRRYEDDSDYSGLHDASGSRVKVKMSSDENKNLKVNGDKPKQSRCCDNSSSGEAESPDEESNDSAVAGSKDPNINGHQRESSPDFDTSKENVKDDSEFECDDEDLDESDDYDEVSQKPKRKPPVVLPVRRAKVSGSDDGNDQDFVVDEDEIDNEESSSSAESASSVDTTSPKKRPPEKVSKPKKRRKVRNGAMKKVAVREIRHKGQVIGRAVSKRSRIYSSDSSDSSYSTGRNKNNLNESEVGTRGRVRKRVRYNEDDSDESESANISSRGRVRKINSRMRDFI